MSTLTLPTPAKFDPAQWSHDTKAPVWYRGTKFDFNVAISLLKFNENEDGYTVTLLDEVTASALNFDPEGYLVDGNYPIYFEVEGNAYHYIVSIWGDRVTIEVSTNETFESLSVMFPETEEQLRLAFATIATDLSR